MKAAGSMCYRAVLIVVILAAAVSGGRLILSDESRNQWALYMLVIPSQVNLGEGTGGRGRAFPCCASENFFLPACMVHSSNAKIIPLLALGRRVSSANVSADISGCGRSSGDRTASGIFRAYAQAKKVKKVLCSTTLDTC